MSKKPQVDSKIEAEYSILGDAPVVTVQQQRQLEKERRAKRKTQAKDMRKEAQSRLTFGDDKKSSILILSVMGALVVGVLLLMIFGRRPAVNPADKEQRENSTKYQAEWGPVEFGESGITAKVEEVFYTRSDGLRVLMDLANAESTAQHPTRIHIILKNGDGELIADAVTTKISEDYYVVDYGRKNFELFIPKEQLKIHDDPLSDISYEIYIDCEESK